jgi:citrate lyase subunit beta / citryl-CoA lyase
MARSLLFVPGHSEKMLKKSLTMEVDEVVWDLEDSVPKIYKSLAREIITKVLCEYKLNQKPIWIRINSLDSKLITSDLRVIHPRIAGVILPKAESAHDITLLESKIMEIERVKGIAPGAIRINSILETPKGIWNALEIANSSRRLDAISLGAEDFTLHLGVDRTCEGIELNYARGRIVLAASIAGIHAIDSVYTDLNNENGLKKESELGRRMGFHGKFAIHPKQITIINQTFYPNEKSIILAKQIVSHFELAQKENLGVIKVEGMMIDLPIYKRAKLLLNQL